MRLINTETLLLEEFYRDIPPYAILSHRWEEEEVVFADYPAQLAVPSSGARKKGFGKIELCAKQARLDGLSYCWVDTCCIDKSSSAELTEAINSMYAWYRDSAVCYIFLSDVDVSGRHEREVPGKGKGKCPIPSEYSWLRFTDDDCLFQLASSQWFTRGWTLQEFLAPAICILYDLEWVPLLKVVKRPTRMEVDRYGPYGIGPKPRWSYDEEEVEEIIEEVTGINAKMLRGFSPTSQSFTIARKMSWASKRTTTRAEDMAYCLMGIFDVNMPLLYGEGAAKAFRRLQEEIIKQSDDHSIFYWRDADADRSAFRGLLARSPADFTDSIVDRFPRDTDLEGYPISTHDKTFGMTNRGLRISLAMLSSGREWERLVVPGDNEEVALLECGTVGWQRYAINLTRLKNGEYARVDAHMLPTPLTLRWVELIHSKPQTRTVFVRQEPVVHDDYKSSRITAVKLAADPAFEIVSTCPEEAWDKKTSQLRPTDGYVARVFPGAFGETKAVLMSSPEPVNRWFKEYIKDKEKSLATAVVHVLVELFPPGVPNIDFTISVRWKSRTEDDNGPYEINVQFDQVHYTGMATQTGWKVSPKSIVWSSSMSSWTVHLGIQERMLMVRDRLVLGVEFLWWRRSDISGKKDYSRSFASVSPSRSLVSYVSSVRPS